MKKFILGMLSICAVSLMACSGNAQTRQEQEVPVAAPAKEAKSDYKIENGQIIPINNRPMMVDFSATWCPPCRQLKPIFEALKDEYKGKIDFVTIDVDEMPQLSASYGVQSIPTIIYINPEGTEISRTIGFHDRDELKADISQQFNL